MTLERNRIVHTRITNIITRLFWMLSERNSVEQIQLRLAGCGRRGKRIATQIIL